MGWDKKADLERVRIAGKQAQPRYGEHELKFKQAQNDIAVIDTRVSACDRVAAELRQDKPSADNFATDDDIADWHQKLDELGGNGSGS